MLFCTNFLDYILHDDKPLGMKNIFESAILTRIIVINMLLQKSDK